MQLFFLTPTKRPTNMHGQIHMHTRTHTHTQMVYATGIPVARNKCRLLLLGFLK